MKKYTISCLLAFVLIIGLASGQRMGRGGMGQGMMGQGRGQERIEAMKIGFITQKLNLSSEEAQKFWPVYNKFSEEQDKQRKAFRGKMMEELSDYENMTEVEADKALNEMINFKMAEVDLARKYVTEFKKVLPTQKVVLLFKAEQEFKRELLRKLKDQRDR